MTGFRLEQSCIEIQEKFVERIYSAAFFLKGIDLHASHSLDPIDGDASHDT